MASVLMRLLDLFQDEGAIIFVDRRPRGPPLFHVVPFAAIKASGTVSGRDTTCNVLVVTDTIYEEPEQLKRTVMALAYDLTVHTVCTQSVGLAEHLADDATTEHWLPCELEYLMYTEGG
ncbi:hypothetical protein F4604DRAFT_1937505 [Suillus subluteus]|nr:hypothetical protein F4604DRAFT_1937505 [Suillus subluteus]